jgi:hypothetical protein
MEKTLPFDPFEAKSQFREGGLHCDPWYLGFLDGSKYVITGHNVWICIQIEQAVLDVPDYALAAEVRSFTKPETAGRRRPHAEAVGRG